MLSGVRFTDGGGDSTVSRMSGQWISIKGTGMRRVSKLQLLLAPVLLAASVGCATPGSVSGYMPGGGQQNYASTHADRTNRLMQIAGQYEQAGKPELAYKMYKHLYDQNADNTTARDRMELIAKGHSALPGVEPTPLDAKDKQFIAQELMIAIADRQELDAKQTKVKTKATPSTQRVADIDWDAIDARNVQKALLAAKEMPAEYLSNQPTGVSALLEHQFFADEPVAHVEKTVDSANPEWLSEAFVDDSLEVVKAEATTEKQVVERIETEIVEELSVWTSAEPVAEFVPQEPKQPSEWAPTSLARYCSDIPSQLHPQVHKLDSTDVATRIEGLQEIRQMGTHAESVNLAVRELLVDPNPLVQAHAAGALHFISGETDESLSTLISVLNNDSDEAIRLASYLLGKMGSAANSARPQLEIIRDRGTDVTSLHAAEALTRITPEDAYSFEKLSIALFGTDHDARWFAAISLGAVSEQYQLDAAKSLKEALRDGSSGVRAAAALSLGGLGESARIAVAELQHAAQHDNQEVRDAATMALACIEL